MRFDTLVAAIASITCAAGGDRTARAQLTPAAMPAAAASGGPGAELALSANLLLVIPSVGGSVATFPELDDFLAGGGTRTRIRPHAASRWHWLRPRGEGFRLDVGVLGDFRWPVPLPYVKASAIVPLGISRRTGGER